MSDCDTGKDGGVASDPDIVAYGHGLGPLYVLVAQFGFERMACGEYADVWAYECVVAYCDLRFVEYGKVEVGEEVPAYADIASVVATERLVDDAPRAAASEQAVENLVKACRIVGIKVVVEFQGLSRSGEHFEKFGHRCVVDLSVEHLLPFDFESCHIIQWGAEK